MKKIICASMLLGLIGTHAAFSQEETEILKIDSATKQLSIQQNEIIELPQPQAVIMETPVVVHNIYEPIMNMIGNYPNKIEVIYSDIDGIIVPESYAGNDYGEKLCASFEKLQKENIPFIFTTGRTFREAKRVANDLNLNPDFYITQDGAEIVKPDGELVFENTINNKLRRKINSEVKWFNYYYKQDLKIAFYQRGQVYTYKNSSIPDLIDIPEEIDRYSQLPDFERAAKIKVYCEDAHTLDIFKRYMQRYYADLSVDTVTSNSIDITMKSANKTNAVRLLSETLGIDIKNSAAFGYAENDVKFLNFIRENGGLAISNEDSYQTVKDNSSYITKSVKEDGFAFAISTILGNNKALKNETVIIEE